MAGNRVNLTFNMSDGEEHSASFVLPGEEQKLQSDIYDRTEGVGAIPGAFGFGYIFDLDKRVILESEGAFNDWVSSVLPGRYYVYGYNGIEVAPGRTLNGIIEVIYPIVMFNGDPTKTDKILIYYGLGVRSVYIGAYTVFINGQWKGWVPVFFDDTELKTIISTKASLESPSFSGTPTTPTPPDDAVGLEIANAAFVRKLISALVDSSPEALDTLNELAAALGDDPNFSTTMLNALAQKQPLHEILTSLSGLASAANKLPYFSGKDVMSMTDLSDVGREIIGKPSKAEVLSYLGVEETAKQINIYDTREGVAAIPGCLGYGMTLNGGISLALTSIDEIALQVNQLEPGRYYATIGMNDDNNGVFEIIWLDNWKNDKTKETATKLVLFFGSDGSIRSTVRGSDASAPVSWVDLTHTFGAAAGMDVQSTIYDRTDGVVARPGAFGYGAFYPVAKRFDDTDGPTEFLMWVMQTPPGRYLVKQVESSGTTKIINGVNFVGMVEIEQPYLEADAGSTASFNKLVHFYGVDGDIYHNRFIADPSNPQMSGWFTFKNQLVNLRSTNGNSWGSPGVGGIMLGVYLGESDSDSRRMLLRGKTIPGSRLGCVSLSGKVSTSGAYQSSPTLVTHSNEVQAGTFMALSGSPSNNSGTDTGYIGLFMRIA